MYVCKRFIGCCLLLVLFSAANLRGQEIKEMTGNLGELFKNLNAADRKLLKDSYLEIFTSSGLTSGEKELVDSLFSDLQQLKVAASPELKYFILSASGFSKRGEGKNLQVWLSGLREALNSPERKRTILKNYLEETAGIACNQVLYQGNGHTWYVRGQVMWATGWPVKINFSEADLICRTRKDSVVIQNTSGVCEVGRAELKGYGGMVKWRKTEEKMWADLNAYQLNLKSPSYMADSVLFHYEGRYNCPFKGRLKDNVLKYESAKSLSFPVFTSYATDILIPEIFPGVTYCGGITYAGNRFTGTGTEAEPATLKIIPNDTINIVLSARQFLFDSLKITAGQTGMVIEMDSGIISHPDINFVYLFPQRTVNIKRITEQSVQIPFKDTYHRILFDVEEIFWPLDSTYMEMRMSSRSGLFKATIESLNYFSDDVYDRIQGMDAINPLNGLLKCSQQKGSDVFTVSDYAAFMKKPVDQLRKQIILLSYQDFVEYDEATDEVGLKQRLYDYTKARVGKQDYDNIRFVSHPENSRVNAVLDTRNFNLTIQGVDKFMISEARNIYVVPADGKVVMMKNRDMSFNGKLNAGMFDMYGQNLFFSYDQYRIDLPKVDSTTMFLAGRDQNVRGKKVESLIRDISGELLIDKPGNKSGKDKDSGFPLLNSRKESYVYFDDPSILNGKYGRDSFYYVIRPYSIKGINDGNNFQYAFDGTLVSNIVAPIRDTLRLMPGNVLGLTYKTPAAGIELYGKGNIRSQITLDRNGFTASGEIKLNRSCFVSDSILLLPGQMTAQTKDIQVDAVKEQRPDAQGEQVRIVYLPGSGCLQATSTTIPFQIYQGKIRHSGTLYVYEDLLNANGKLELEHAELKSSLFHLQAQHISSQKTALNLSSLTGKGMLLNTSDVRADINLEANKGKFVNNMSANRIEFVSSRYACTFESFTWYMKEAFLNIGVEEKERLTEYWSMEERDSLPAEAKNIFMAMDTRADSLSFVAPLAHYDLNTENVDCYAVNHIDIANGRFYPALGEVYIRKKGVIEEMKGGRLLCERTDTTHILNDVSLNVRGRYDFSGTGDYTYVNEEKEGSVIQFGELAVDSLKGICAKTQISPENALNLNKGFCFQGNVELHSTRPDLFFDGYVGLTSDTAYLKSHWMAVKTELSADRIRIPVKTENRDNQRQRIYNGIFLGTDNIFRPYAAFMSKRLFYKDDLLSGGNGVLEWSPAMGHYMITDTVADKYYRFCYDPQKEIISAFDRLNLDLNLPGITQKSVGDISYNLKEEELLVEDMFYTLDFVLLPKMEEVLLKDMASFKLKSIRVDQRRLRQMEEMYGKTQMPGLEKQLKRLTANVPDSLGQLWVLDSLNMAWNMKNRSYMADGQVCLVASRYRPVEKMVQIKLELVRKRSGNQFFMYIYDDKVWYYFEYNDKNLYTFSSNPEYNEILKLEKADKKVIRSKDKEILYTITLSPESMKERFLKRFRMK